jgi:prephenate dehydrogenase
VKIDGPVKIIGCGLIGTSLALRLKEFGFELILSDTNEANLKLAEDLVANRNAVTEPEIILISTPPEVVFSVASEEFVLHPKATFIDVSGIKSNLIHEVEGISALAEQFVSVHPMAGREISGPESARADLFESRAWIISETNQTSRNVLEKAKGIGELMGASIYELSADKHDSVIATISHLPQILSSALGASLVTEDPIDLNLAGQGLRDVSRLADSDPDLWESLLAGNSKEILPKLTEVINRLSGLNEALRINDRAHIKEFLKSGREGRNRIPGKHGSTKRDYTYVPIVIDDKPGGLARIFNECAAINVNVEDLLMEHSPGQSVGLITLALAESDAVKLQKHLVSKGWLAHEPRKH